MNAGEVKTEGAMLKHSNGGFCFIQKLQTFIEILVKRPKLFLNKTQQCPCKFKAENPIYGYRRKPKSKNQTFVASRPREVRAKEATTSQSLSHSNTLKLSVWVLDFDRQISAGEDEDEEEEIKLELTLFLFMIEFLLTTRAQLLNAIDKVCIFFLPLWFQRRIVTIQFQST